MSNPFHNPATLTIHSAMMDCAEINPSFYTETTFQFNNPSVGLEWLTKITPRRAQLLRKIYCYVHPVHHTAPYQGSCTNELPNGQVWCEFIEQLCTLATSGLEEVKFYLDSEPICNCWGPSVNLGFVRALGCMTGLKRLEIDGYFPKEWPQYLEEKTGRKVWEEEGKKESYVQKLREFQGLFRDHVIDG